MNVAARADGSGEAAVEARAAALRHEHYRPLAERADRFFAILLCVEWACAIATAHWLSPRVWGGAQPTGYAHELVAGVVGAVAVVPPVLLAIRRLGAWETRYVIAIGQMLIGALLIHLVGGRFGAPFHVFGSLAVLARYRDYRVLLVASAVVGANYVVCGLLSPGSVDGVVDAQPLPWIEHAAWVVFENFFLVIACIRGREEIAAVAERRARLELQSGLEQGAREAYEASRAKSEFLANMSHEIRTPMTSIIGYADLLLDPEISPSEHATHIQTIRRNGEHLLGIINDILDLSKIEAGRMTVERLRCSPSSILVDVVSLMRVRALEKGLFMEVHFQTPIPESIESDPTRLRQILMNLTGNAIKFTDAGGIRILAACETSGGQPILSLRVVDTGIGLAPAQCAQLFQPFAQVDSSMTRRFGGTGLGLAICQRFAAMLGGDIRVESSPGRGSSFELRVTTGPLDGVEMLEDLADAELSDERAAGKREEAPLRLDASVLLAEDGPDNQVLISTHLVKAGASVLIAENGRVAVDKVLDALRGKRPFDVVLMDMQMPELDGYAATTELRRSGYTGPIIALTAHAMAGDRERCLMAGCSEYLTKPIAPRTLIQAIAKHAKAFADERGDTSPIVLRARRLRAARDEARSAAHVVMADDAPRPTHERRDEPLFSSLARDPEMAGLVERFVRGLPAQVAAIEAALAAGTPHEARKAAHQLKGAAGGYGFDSITKAAADLEHATKLLTNATGCRATLGGLPRAPSDVERVNAAECFRVLANLCARASAARPAA